jgi:hypothetical protein
MCDYSLEHVASRPAAIADRLISTNFPGTATRGFAGAGDMGTAVCLRPGTELVFDHAPRYENPVTYGEETAPSATARFRQIDRDVPHVHHDALEFSDGVIIPVARLIQGQWATVLQLPHVAETASPAEAASGRELISELEG